MINISEMLLLSSFSLSWGKKLSEVTYYIVKLKGEDNIGWFGSMQGHGKEYCFYILLLVALSFALAFYFGVASKVQNATKQNYRGMYIMGYIALVILSCIGMAVFVTPSAVKTLPMLEICLCNIFWYSVLFEVFSLLFKDLSKAQGVHLLNCW